MFNKKNNRVHRYKYGNITDKTKPTETKKLLFFSKKEIGVNLVLIISNQIETIVLLATSFCQRLASVIRKLSQGNIPNYHVSYINTRNTNLRYITRK